MQGRFANTGREMPETEFVQECGERWRVPVTVRIQKTQTQICNR